MKRFCLLLALLLPLLTAAASAADGYAVENVRLVSNGAAVTVTAGTNCTLAAALYDSAGQMVEAQFAPVTGGASQKAESVTFTAPVPEKGYIRAVLLDGNDTPLCKMSDSRNTPDTPSASDVYAILYEGGELVFQHGDTPEAGKTVRAKYPVDLNGYDYDWGKWEPSTPWYADRENITSARFADTIQPASAAHWFSGLSKLENVNLSGFDTSRVTNMFGMFRFCSSLKTLDLSPLDTSRVTNMRYLFDECSSLTALNLSGVNTSRVTDMGCMFGLCRSLTDLDVSGFDTSCVTSMSMMFFCCRGLTALDVSGFDTSNVTSMHEMFNGCSSLTALDVSKFNTSRVTEMLGMFVECRGLTALDVSNFDTSNVTDMRSMFSYCSGLTELDLSGFDTSRVTQMSHMFTLCDNLKTVSVSASFVTDAVTESEEMFDRCTSLVGGAGTKYDSAHIDKEYARIDGGASAPGYFTRKSA